MFQTPLQSSLSKTEVSDSSLDLCSSFTYFLYDSDTFYLGSYTYRDLSFPFQRLKYFLPSHFNRMYSIITVITLSFTTDIPPNSSAKMAFYFLSHCAASGLFNSRTTPSLCSFLAPMALGSLGLWAEHMVIFVMASLALAMSSHLVSSCMLLVSTIRSLSINT